MPIRALFPIPSPVDDPMAAVAAEPRPAPDDRPWVLANMVGTIDGGTAVGGVSGPLGGPSDRKVFAALRAVADVILAGAATVSAERDRVPAPPAVVRERRLEEGRAERPLIAVVTGSLSLRPDLPLFDDADYRPLILTTASAPVDARQALAEVAEIVEVGTERVDLGRAHAVLAERGHRTVLSEGGPSLNGQLVAADLVDEWNLTVSPMLAAGDSARPAHGPEVPDPRRLALDRLWMGDDLLFGRWIRSA